MFIGPYEHHSNELPWRESIADVVVIPEDADGHIDLDRLDAELAAHGDRPLRIGSFSAASNVTGIVSNTTAISTLLHRHGALSFYDFAAAAPYVRIDMAGKDAVFLSPHKFIGGPSTPGVLVVRRELVTNRVPDAPGGGTVAYVNPTEHRYLTDPVLREEGGTTAVASRSPLSTLAGSNPDCSATPTPSPRPDGVCQSIRGGSTMDRPPNSASQAPMTPRLERQTASSTGGMMSSHKDRNVPRSCSRPYGRARNHRCRCAAPSPHRFT